MRSRRSLPAELFTVVDGVEDPWHLRPGLRWKLHRYLDPNAHRFYVGGDAGSNLPFRESCRFQIDFLVDRGLRPDSVLLDLGCGSLRGGIHFIDHLEPGCYLGIDISATAVSRGIRKELGVDVFHAKRPQFVISRDFDFDRLRAVPDVVFANSVFTHLPESQLRRCLDRLRTFVGHHGTVFYATFTEVAADSRHDGTEHYLGGRIPFTYTRSEMEAIASETGWTGEYIGHWGHPKNVLGDGRRFQMMMSFRA